MRKETEGDNKNSQKAMNKMAICAYLLIITLNVSGLNLLFKRQSGWTDQKHKTHLYTVYRRLKSGERTQTESEGVEKVFHMNGNKKKAEVAIIISDKIDFKTKTVIKYEEGH